MNRISRNFLLLLAAATVGCRPTPQQSISNVVVRLAETTPDDPADKAWRSAPEFPAKLILQDLVEPRQLKATTPEVRVRALTDGRDLAVRLEWDDPSDDDLPGPAMFLDACAIQLPSDVQPSVPAPQMGEAGRPVEISYWNAAWQAMVDGRKDSLSELYPNAAIDGYPFKAQSLEKDPAAKSEMTKRYSPARALGNMMAGPRDSPVEDLIAEGPSTISKAPRRSSRGAGVRTADGWAVVIIRPLPAGLSSKNPTQIALAVWRGEEQEVGARKMRTAWIPLTVEEKP